MERQKGHQASRPRTLLAWMGLLAEQALNNGKLRRAEIWRTTRNSFLRFRSESDLPLAKLDNQIVQDYDLWLDQRGLCRNTRSFYLRNLRSAYNKVAAGLCSQKDPFRNVYTGIPATPQTRPGFLPSPAFGTTRPRRQTRPRLRKGPLPPQLLPPRHGLRRPRFPPAARPPGRTAHLHPAKNRTLPLHPVGTGHATASGRPLAEQNPNCPRACCHGGKQGRKSAPTAKPLPPAHPPWKRSQPQVEIPQRPLPRQPRPQGNRAPHRTGKRPHPLLRQALLGEHGAKHERSPRRHQRSPRAWLGTHDTHLPRFPRPQCRGPGQPHVNKRIMKTRYLLARDTG